MPARSIGTMLPFSASYQMHKRAVRVRSSSEYALARASSMSWATRRHIRAATRHARPPIFAALVVYVSLKDAVGMVLVEGLLQPLRGQHSAPPPPAETALPSMSTVNDCPGTRL